MLPLKSFLETDVLLFWLSGVQVFRNGDFLDGVLVRERLCSLSLVASENLKKISIKAQFQLFHKDISPEQLPTASI